MNKIIVIDPCYITADADWQVMCDLGDYVDEKLDDPFDVIFFPRTVKSSYRDKEYKKIESGRAIIHAIKGTKNGDGSYGKLDVDSGTLSVCEVDEKIYEMNKQHSYSYETVDEALEKMEYFCSKI